MIGLMIFGFILVCAFYAWFPDYVWLDRAGVLGNSRLMACHKNIAQHTPLKSEKIVNRGHVGRI